MERPPRQGEERGGRRGSPQALTGGVSASRLLHAHALRGSGYARKIERTIHLLCAVQGDSSTGPPQSWWVSFDGCHGFAGPKAVGAERLESLARHGFGRRNERARPTGGLGGSAAVGRSVSCRWRGDLGPGAVAGVRAVRPGFARRLLAILVPMSPACGPANRAPVILWPWVARGRREASAGQRWPSGTRAPVTRGRSVAWSSSDSSAETEAAQCAQPASPTRVGLSEMPLPQVAE
jgi:hypothetical protein